MRKRPRPVAAKNSLKLLVTFIANQNPTLGDLPTQLYQKQENKNESIWRPESAEFLGVITHQV